MAITYHSGERIQGLEYTAPSITLDEPFTSDNWVDSASSQFAVNTSTARLEFLDDENATGDLCSYDLENLIGSAVSTTEWLLRFKFRFSTLASGSHYYEFCMGLSDSSTAVMNANQNFIGFRCLPSSIASLFRPRVCDGTTTPRTGSSADLSQTFAINTDYFCEIKRTSESNWSISLSTTSAYDGDLQDASYTDASGATGLRYIKIGDAVTNVTAGADMEGYIDDVEFHNGSTSVVVEAGDAKPTNVPDYTRFEETDTRKMYSYLPPPAVTFEDDFSSYASQASADASWITNATNVRVNILTDKLGFAWTAGTPNQQCYYDLGASVSETEWVLRFVVNYSTLTSASAHLPVADIKMSGSSSSANYPLAASQISFQLSAGSGSANVYFKSTNTSGSGEVSPTAIAWNPTTGTDYYVEMIRTSATHATLNVRTGSHSGTMVTNFPMNLTSINSGCTGLRYLRLQQYPNSFGNITGTLGDVKFYNGVTSVVTTNSWKEKGTT